jgi:hypothetical protein
MSFDFYENIGQEDRTGSVWEFRIRDWVENVEKGCRRVNMVQICVHMYVNGKMRPVKTSRLGEKMDKGEGWRV